MKWTKVNLSDVSLIIMGQSPPGDSYNDSKNGLPFFQGKAEFGDISPVAVKWCNQPNKIAEAKDILLSVRAPVGSTNIADQICCIGRGLAAIRCHSEKAFYKYIYWFFKFFEISLSAQGQGSTFKAINKKIIEDIQIPLPPIEEQKRIAAILDKADEVRRKRQEAIALTEELARSHFLHLFGDPLVKTENTIQLSKIAEITMGQSPPGDSYNSIGEGIPLLNGPAEFGEIHPTEKQWTNKPTRICQPGDILFCVRGATAGRLNWADKPYCIGRGLAAIRPQLRTGINSEFIFMLLEHLYDYFQDKGVGSTFINISKRDLESLPIPIVNTSDTNYFGSLSLQIKNIHKAHRKSFNESNNLFNSLLQRAFKGEL